jgi:nucleotide-binding universal stress UspA family protein
MANDDGGVVVIGYDGSDAAQQAIGQAAQLFGSRDALVVTVFQDAQELLMPSGVGVPVGRVGPELVDAIREHAEEVARDGAELAGERGLKARPEGVEAEGRVADAIVTLARERGASAIVVGSRGLGGVKSALLGSVSSRLVHEADRPLLVVPPAGS